VDFSRSYDLNIQSRRSSVTYRITNGDLQVIITPPDENAAIQTLPMSENPEEIYRGFLDRAVGSARIFASRPEVKDELSRTYRRFLEEYRGQEQTQTESPPSTE